MWGRDKCAKYGLQCLVSRESPKREIAWEHLRDYMG
nr:MAG TPA: hypothetical protein [Caudoviricetes sp.]